MPKTSLRDPARLLPAEPHVRAIAQELLERVVDAPIVSPHGHVPARWLSDDTQFSDPADLLIVHDHYVTRLLHAQGVPLEDLGVGGSPADPREAWRTLCSHWLAFSGTASAYWLAESLAQVFGIDETPSRDNADYLYDTIDTALRLPELRPRELFDRFNIDVLATTDDPMDTLEHHAALALDPTFSGRVIPTFRPDAYTDPEAPRFGERVATLIASEPGAATTFPGYLSALRSRRLHFKRHGAVSADHGVVEPFTCELDAAEAERLFQSALAGTLDAEGARVFRGHMLWQMAAMSVEDGLVMTIHAGVRRNHHTATFERFGPDTGHDIPIRTEYVDNLRPLLQSFGTAEGFHLVLFAIDETVYSRELAPLAGFYPSVYVGAPWWFLDAPDAMRRFREAVTETAGFYRTSGFIDDTRAYLSIPARHGVARRADASYLARLVAEGRLPLETAQRVIDDTVDSIPRKVFKL
ncbi:glucuronate isomerase [Demequina zhanjiangensis]|uniref:Uronate isomerase n=1 Tax=Demequina zhanjiangensis TaxID=3051659 RepID=A0ABT8G1P1_9MICO|nr:glucuronate isomerase [Demequina sp. SYSU T00b26]MDN4473045.1 glucuronate isomerase [Demequina sp. SYSU T00b26]